MNPDEVVMFELDGELIDTDLDHWPWTHSYVGALLQNGGGGGDADKEADEALALGIARLERTCEAFDSVDPSGAAAELSLRRRVGGLALLATALRNVRSFVLSDEHRELFTRGGLIEPYLSSVHMWTSDVTETLEHLARELNALAPDWSAFRECMSNVEWIYARAMGEQSRLKGVADALPDDIRAALDELFVAFVRFKHALAEPFG